VLAATPGLLERVRANRAFLARAVRFLAAEAGIRQFLDIGGQRRHNERAATPQTLRTRDEVSGFFDGLELVPPGLSYVHAWRPGPGAAAPAGGVSAYGVARTPG
jgi:S-adenosyl methyltransferase